jgi:uncharacterized protein (DUF2062 family)
MTLHLHHRKLITVALVFITSWIVGTFFIHRFEAGHPIGENYFNALYFTVITTATIGFGDLVPMTIAGKVLTMFYAVFYVPLFLYTMNILLQARFDRIRIEDEELEQEMQHVESDINAILDGRSPSKSKKSKIYIAKK